MNSEDELALKYLLLIKKTVSHIRSRSFSGYADIEEDDAHDAFLKLLGNGFFARSDHSGEKSYIYKTVENCFIDRLKSMGVIRNLTKAEKEKTGKKTESITFLDVDDADEVRKPVSDSISQSDALYAEQAYRWIKACFEAVYNKISNAQRQAFFKSAFWFDNEDDIPLKELAALVGYTSSNPTQEFNRLVNKVSLCTEPNGVSVVNPKEQVQFLLEQIESMRVER